MLRITSVICPSTSKSDVAGQCCDQESTFRTSSSHLSSGEYSSNSLEPCIGKSQPFVLLLQITLRTPLAEYRCIRACNAYKKLFLHLTEQAHIAAEASQLHLWSFTLNTTHYKSLLYTSLCNNLCKVSDHVCRPVGAQLLRMAGQHCSSPRHDTCQLHVESTQRVGEN